MLVRAVGELLGREVRAKDGRVGVLEDVYFDRDCWDLCYLLIAAGERRALVCSQSIEFDSPAQHAIYLSISRAQIESGAGAWAMDDAVTWLEDIRVCGARQAIGWRVLAEDAPMGVVSDLFIERRTWSIVYLVVKSGPSFGERHFPVAIEWADPLDPLEATVRVRRTRAQLCFPPSAVNGTIRLRAR